MSNILRAMVFCLLSGFMAGIVVWLDNLDSRVYQMEQQQTCNCSISYGGHNMSVEDAFERAGEGLTADQADAVQVLIEEYCNDR